MQGMSAGVFMYYKEKGTVEGVPSLQKKMKGQINQYIIGSHEKVIQEARQSLSLPQRHYKNTSFKQTACRSNMTGRL